MIGDCDRCNNKHIELFAAPAVITETFGYKQVCGDCKYVVDRWMKEQTIHSKEKSVE